MKEKFNISGKNLSEESKESTSDFISGRVMVGAEKIEGEYEKEPMEIDFIEKINLAFEKEFEEMQIDNDKEITPNQIHILNDQLYKENFGDSDGVDVCFDESIFINKEKIIEQYNNPRVKYLKVLLHEMVHSQAYKKVHSNFDKEINHNQITTKRLGYRVENSEELNHVHFLGFNEAITEKITSEMEGKYFEDILEELGFSEDEMFEVKCGSSMAPAYQNQVDIINIIIEKIAKTKNEDEQVVWQRIKKGYFTGNMMHLRDVEKACGKGSLRMLAAIDSGMKDLPRTENIRHKMYRQIKEYFKSDDNEHKDKLARSVLIEREKMKYDDRKK